MRTFTPLKYLALALILGIVLLPTLGLSNAQTPPSTCVNPYMVMDGDSLSKIAQRFGVDMNELALANNIENPRYIRIGDVLCLDGLVEAIEPPSGTGGASTPTPTPASGTSSATPTVITGRANATGTFNGRPYTTDSQGYYTVQTGDNLYRIASAFGLTISDLINANQLQEPSRIFSGNKILIPAQSVPSPTSTPTPANTNPATTTTPAPIVTTTPIPATPRPIERPNESLTVDGRTYTTNAEGYYTVQAGDTLYAVALAFGVSRDALIAANPDANGRVFTGQRLSIPAPTPSQPVPGNIPALALVPLTAGPGDTVTVLGYNYPPNAEIELYLEKFSLGRTTDTLETAETDTSGHFEVELTIPATWPDKWPINTRTVSITAQTADEQFWATNFFINLAWEN